MSIFRRDKPTMPEPNKALPGRAKEMPVEREHYVLGTDIKGPFPDGMEVAIVGMGCFWGAERRFWQLDGVHTTAVGYVGGYTENPTYREVCSGQTGHTEGVLIVFNPDEISYREILREFWEEHDPTQNMRQGNDVGTQYRSMIVTTNERQQQIAEQTREEFQHALDAKGLNHIATEILEDKPFYYAETPHQQYLAKNPGGYCGLQGTGATFAG